MVKTKRNPTIMRWIERRIDYCFLDENFLQLWVIVMFLLVIVGFVYSSNRENYGVIIMILTSVDAALLVLFTERMFMELKLENVLSVLEGWYLGFGYDKQNKTEKSKPQSKARVKYERGNRLNIIVESGKEEENGEYEWKWEGTMIMNKDYERIGEISWRYTEKPNNQPESMRILGFKRCMVNGKDEIILIGEELEDYRKEFLHKKTEDEFNNAILYQTGDDEKKKELITKHKGSGERPSL